MKIIFSNYDDLKNPYYAGGGARAVHEVARRLAKENKVTVVTGKYPGGKDETIDGVRYVRTGAVRGGPKAGQLAYQLSLLPRVMRGDFDVWVESFTPPFSTSFLPIFTRRKVIGLVHMLAAQDMTRKYKLPIFHLVENLGLKLYKYFITPSDEVGEKITRIRANAEIEKIPNGVDLIKKSAKKSTGKYILFLGRIEVDQKGLDLLLEAYAKIQTKIKYPLVIAGSGEKPELKKLKTLIRKLGIVKSVVLTGRVEDRQKNDLFEKARLVVIPSRCETFSLVALETLAAGKGLITFDISGFKWIPGQAAIKIACFDVPQLASQMLLLSKDGRLLFRMGKSGAGFARKLSWENISRRYTRFILRIAREGER